MLQHIPNAAASVIVGSMSVWRHLHWLCVRQRVNFKNAINMYKTIQAQVQDVFSEVFFCATYKTLRDRQYVNKVNMQICMHVIE
jgi:hypothetical protein